MSLALRVSAVSKSYDGNNVLNDCSFMFKAGGVYVLMGDNGCGKSTFLRICALLERPDRGKVEYFSDGREVEMDISLKRRISMVLHKPGLFNTTVFNNAAYGLKIRGLEKKEIHLRVDEVLQAVGLSGKEKQNALTLSSGETQRLGIARAMAIRPEMLFLDEPTASIDRQNTGIIEDIILGMKKNRRSTIIITTHDRQQADRLAGTLLSLDKSLTVIQS